MFPINTPLVPRSENEYLFCFLITGRIQNSVCCTVMVWRLILYCTYGPTIKKCTLCHRIHSRLYNARCYGCDKWGMTQTVASFKAFSWSEWNKAIGASGLPVAAVSPMPQNVDNGLQSQHCALTYVTGRAATGDKRWCLHGNPCDKHLLQWHVRQSLLHFEKKHLAFECSRWSDKDI
jgi:hypothetical protein